MTQWNNLLDDVKLENFKDKNRIVRQLVRYMLARTERIFEYRNLPDTIPSRKLEQIIQIGGVAGIAEVDGNLYAFGGGLGGEPDVYYEPTIFTVANPALNFSKNLEINKDVALIRNDSYYTGLMPLFIRYASLQAENAISLRIADINTRIKAVFSGSDDNTKASIDLFMERIEGGDLAAIAEETLLESLNVTPMSDRNNALTDLIEYEQYIKAAWYNEIGIDANYNMKREAINASEAQMNNDALLPLIDDMLFNRKEGIKKANEMFSTNIEVELSGVWDKEQKMQLFKAPGITEETSENPEEEKEEWKEEKEEAVKVDESDIDVETPEEKEKLEEEEKDNEETS